MKAMTTMNERHGEHLTEYVTVTIGAQLFGLPIARVQDVFMPTRVTGVPLSAPEIAGVLNLRGRIVTAVDMRCRLGLGKREDGQEPMAIGIEFRAEAYCLLVDSVGEVLKLTDNTREANPVNLDARLARVSAGVYRLDQQLLVILNVDSVLDMGSDALAA